MIPPIVFRLLIAGVLAAIAGRLIIRDKANRKQASNILFNGVWAYVLVVKLSLLLTHFEAIGNEPMLMLYGWGGQLNTSLGIMSVVIYYAWYVWKKADKKLNNSIFFGVSGLVFLLGFMLSAQFFKPGSDSQTLPENLGMLKSIDGEVLDFAPGQITVLNFWATWCAPCRAEMPELNAFTKAHPEVNFIAINNIGSERSGISGVREFIAEKGYEFVVVPDHDDKLTSQFSVTSFPTTIVFDAQGNQIAKHVGVISEGQLEGFID